MTNKTWTRVYVFANMSILVGKSTRSQCDVCLQKVSSSLGSTNLNLTDPYHLEVHLQSWEVKKHPLQDEAIEN